MFDGDLVGVGTYFPVYSVVGIDLGWKKSKEHPDGWYMKHELNDTTNNQSASTGNFSSNMLD